MTYFAGGKGVGNFIENIHAVTFHRVTNRFGMLGRFGIVQNGQADLDDATGLADIEAESFLKARQTSSEIPAEVEITFSAWKLFVRGIARQ